MRFYLLINRPFIEVTTVEGIIDRSVIGLQQDQKTRRAQYPELADQIDGIIKKLTNLKEVKEPFTFVSTAST